MTAYPHQIADRLAQGSLAQLGDINDRERDYYFHASTLMDGDVRVDGMLPAEVGQLLVAALE